MSLTCYRVCVQRTGLSGVGACKVVIEEISKVILSVPFAPGGGPSQRSSSARADLKFVVVYKQVMCNNI